jgi:hypothetical protein
VSAGGFYGSLESFYTGVESFCLGGSELFRARFHLRGWGCGSIAGHMNNRAACLIASVVIFSSCEGKKEMTVTETRAATTRDASPKLFATSDERFRDAKPSPVQGQAPESWLALPASQFRLLNYRFGESGMGEVWVSLASGSVLDNVNRWLGQFGATKLNAEALEKLTKIPIAGTSGVWVEADGEYASGMGAEPKPGFALAGVVTSLGDEILTVKMVGPKKEVDAAKSQLEAFAKTLRKAEGNSGQ